MFHLIAVISKYVLVDTLPIIFSSVVVCLIYLTSVTGRTDLLFNFGSNHIA